MKLTLVEESDWHTNRKSKQPPRIQTIAKQYEIRKCILKAVANATTQPSDALSWSHPHLEDEDGEACRFCVDWKGPNTQTESSEWPLLNVRQKVDRLRHSKEMKTKIKPMLEGYLHIFRQELPNKPANIEPTKLSLIEESDWYTNRKNKQPPRIQIIAKQYEIRKFILKTIANAIIRPSNAPSWSHPHLEKKKDGETYCFCIYWKGLNTQTESNGWPLLNIRQIIERLGTKKANFFAVIDLTQGYWQIPLHPDSRHLTAFRTAEGLYE